MAFFKKNCFCICFCIFLTKFHIEAHYMTHINYKHIMTSDLSLWLLTLLHLTNGILVAIRVIKKNLLQLRIL